MRRGEMLYGYTYTLCYLISRDVEILISVHLMDILNHLGFWAYPLGVLNKQGGDL